MNSEVESILLSLTVHVWNDDMLKAFVSGLIGRHSNSVFEANYVNIYSSDSSYKHT